MFFFECSERSENFKKLRNLESNLQNQSKERKKNEIHYHSSMVMLKCVIHQMTPIQRTTKKTFKKQLKKIIVFNHFSDPHRSMGLNIYIEANHKLLQKNIGKVLYKILCSYNVCRTNPSGLITEMVEDFE